MATTLQDPHKAVITSVGSAIGGGTASSSKPVITGTADAGTTVDIFDGVRMIGTALVDSKGNWSFTPTADLKAGSHSFTAISIDRNGDMGASSTPMSVKVPSGTPVAPVKPVIDGGGPTDDAGHPLSNPTNDPRPEMSGTGTPGDTITMYDGNTPIGSTVIDNTGHWIVKPEKDLEPGNHDIYVIETNPAGVPSVPSDHYPVVIDTSIPAAPVVTGLTDDNGIAIPSGGATPDGHPTMNGTGAPGDIVKMYDGQEVIGSAKVDANGQWSITPSKDLSDATHDLYAIETNAAGTSGPTSAHIVITIDSSMPATPVAPTMTDDRGATIPAGGTTADPHPHIDGKGTAGDTITVYDNGVVIGSTTVNGDGTWSFTPSPDLGPGNHDIVVIETNPAGTPSNPSDPIHVVIDTSVPATPAAPTLTDDHGSTIPAGSTTTDAHPQINGTGTAGDTIRIYDGSTVIGSTTVDSDGKWSFTPSPDLGPGSHDIHVTDTNAAGTSSAASDSIHIVIDPSGLIPAQPAAPFVTDDAGLAIPQGTTTSDAHPNISGTGKAGDVIRVYDGSTVLGSTTIDSNGKWTFKPTSDLAATSHSISVVEVSPSGVPSVASDSAKFSIATQYVPPPVFDPFGTYYNDDGSVQTFTSGPSHSLSGAGAVWLTLYGVPGAKLSIAGDIIFASVRYQNTTFDANGKLSIDLFGWVYTDGNGKNVHAPISGLSGSYCFTQTVGGVTSAVSSIFTFQQSQPVPPTTPFLTDDSNNLIAAGGLSFDRHPHINGTGTAGSTVTIYDGKNTVIGATTVGSNGKWTFTPVHDLSPGAHDIWVTQKTFDGGNLPASNSVHFIADLLPAQSAFTLNDTGWMTATSLTTIDTQLTLGGTSVVGHVITVYDGSKVVGSTTVDSTNKWTFKTAALSTGTHSLTVVDTNSTGIKSPASVPVAVSVVSTIPAPVLDHLTFNGIDYALGSNVPEVTVGSLFTVHGTGYPGATGTLALGGVGFGGYSFTVGADGTWSLTGSGSYITPATFKATLSCNGVVSSVGSADVYVVPVGYHPVQATLVHDDTSAVVADSDSNTTAQHHTVVAEHDTYIGKVANGNETVDLNADPSTYFKEATAHIEGAKHGAVDTLHLTGDHQVLDLTSLTGQTAAAKISGIEVVDLGGQHNTLKLSLVDVLNLGETDLFQKDGKQQMMVQGKDGDTVDLSNTHIAGLADGEWAAHGTTQVGGVTYNVYEHSGAHTELLVQQGVQIVVH